MTRSLWKGPFSEIQNHKEFKNKIWSRRSVILPKFLGKSFLIYNGQHYIPLKISEEMIGHKFGEFSSTRKKPYHKKKQKK
jgi:small subunit ribosomal protein S19